MLGLDVAPGVEKRRGEERKHEEREARPIRSGANAMPSGIAAGARLPAAEPVRVRSRRHACEHERGERDTSERREQCDDVGRAVMHPLAGEPDRRRREERHRHHERDERRHPFSPAISAGSSEPMVLERLQCERQEQRGDGDADDDVGERQRLHDRVDDGSALRRDVGEDRRGAVLAIADREQQHVRRGLADAHAHGDVDQVAARDDPVEADAKSHTESAYGRIAHRAVPRRHVLLEELVEDDEEAAADGERRGAVHEQRRCRRRSAARTCRVP